MKPNAKQRRKELEGELGRPLGLPDDSRAPLQLSTPTQRSSSSFSGEASMRTRGTRERRRKRRKRRKAIASLRPRRGLTCSVGTWRAQRRHVQPGEHFLHWTALLTQPVTFLAGTFSSGTRPLPEPIATFSCVCLQARLRGVPAAAAAGEIGRRGDDPEERL